jgi:hypothetical protein
LALLLATNLDSGQTIDTIGSIGNYLANEKMEYGLNVLYEILDLESAHAVLYSALQNNNYAFAINKLINFGYQKIPAGTLATVIENCDFYKMVQYFQQNRNVPDDVTKSPSEMIENYILLVTNLNNNSYKKDFSDVVANNIYAHPLIYSSLTDNLLSAIKPYGIVNFLIE